MVGGRYLSHSDYLLLSTLANLLISQIVCLKGVSVDGSKFGIFPSNFVSEKCPSTKDSSPVLESTTSTSAKDYRPIPGEEISLEFANIHTPITSSPKSTNNDIVDNNHDHDSQGVKTVLRVKTDSEILPKQTAKVSDWEVEDVCKWISTLEGFSQYVENFRDHQMDGNALISPFLDINALKELGIFALERRLFLMNKVSPSFSSVCELDLIFVICGS